MIRVLLRCVLILFAIGFSKPVIAMCRRQKTLCQVLVLHPLRVCAFSAVSPVLCAGQHIQELWDHCKFHDDLENDTASLRCVPLDTGRRESYCSCCLPEGASSVFQDSWTRRDCKEDPFPEMGRTDRIVSPSDVPSVSMSADMGRIKCTPD